MQHGFLDVVYISKRIIYSALLGKSSWKFSIFLESANFPHPVLKINFTYFSVATKYVPIGCFKDKGGDNAIPVLIANLQKYIDWRDMSKTIVHCARLVEKAGYLYFGIQYYGECRSGPLVNLTYDKYGPAGDHKCWSGVGGSFTNFVYMLIPQGK